MANYRFRLEPVRRLREARRDELRGQLADAYRAAEVITEQRRKVLAELAGVRSRQQQLAREQNLSVNRIVEHQRYELILESQSKDLAEKLKLVEQEVDRRRNLVADADREVRTLDKLEERQRTAHRLGEQRADAKLMDEIALQTLAGRGAGGAGGDAK